MKQKKIPTILIIAGSDSGGGAGIQADIKAASYFKVFATTAVTAVTAQNTLGCLLYTSPSPRDSNLSRMPSSA